MITIWINSSINVNIYGKLRWEISRSVDRLVLLIIIYCKMANNSICIVKLGGLKPIWESYLYKHCNITVLLQYFQYFFNGFPSNIYNIIYKKILLLSKENFLKQNLYFGFINFRLALRALIFANIRFLTISMIYFS